MPRGDKSSYTDKQKRQAEHIEESEKDQGRSEAAAERIAWATVNKQDGGGKKSGGARKSTRKTTKKSVAKKAPAKGAAAKSAATKSAKKTAARKAARSRT
ncbi:plasmid stabilization system protein ParE [Stenotrophomonas sp. JAI102]|nr:plasmid stabilization system protein ParE [Stenotrophomonas sp. JAI102]